MVALVIGLVLRWFGNIKIISWKWLFLLIALSVLSIWLRWCHFLYEHMLAYLIWHVLRTYSLVLSRPIWKEFQIFSIVETNNIKGHQLTRQLSCDSNTHMDFTCWAWAWAWAKKPEPRLAYQSISANAERL